MDYHMDLEFLLIDNKAVRTIENLGAVGQGSLQCTRLQLFMDDSYLRLERIFFLLESLMNISDLSENFFLLGLRESAEEILDFLRMFIVQNDNEIPLTTNIYLNANYTNAIKQNLDIAVMHEFRDQMVYMIDRLKMRLKDCVWRDWKTHKAWILKMQ